MALDQAPRYVSFARSICTEKSCVEKPGTGSTGRNALYAAQHFAAIIAGHAHRRNLRCALVQVQIARVANLDTSIGKNKLCARRTAGNSEKLVVQAKRFVLLAADSRHFARHLHILRIAVHAAKGVTGKRARRGLVPGHDHARVQPAGQRYAHAPRPLK